MENLTAQEKKERRNQMARACYQARKENINAKRRELWHMKKNAKNSHEASSSSNPLPLQEPIPEMCLQNRLALLFSTEYTYARNAFRSKLDNLANISTCVVCMEKYPGIKTRQWNGHSTCYRCISEKNGHRFSISNNMDPGEQPVCLKVLTQIEEMLIARVSPVIQVSYATGGQLKYSGHTICFPQDISSIATQLPRQLDALDILIVNKKNIKDQEYSFYVSKKHVYEALHYKILFDPYYKDVQIDENALSLLPDISTNISNLLYTTCLNPESVDVQHMETEDLDNDMPQENNHIASSFVANLAPACREIQKLRSLLHLEGNNQTPTIEWPPITLSPINEYNTEGLFVMAFPALFPTGAASFGQQPFKEVKLHEYAQHLLRYYDNRFGQHPRFRYFVLNIILRHQSQATASVFARRNIEAGLPTSIEDLRQRLKDMPDDKLADHLMRFGSTVRGTRPFWNRCSAELSDMVNQVGCPTLFFTLSAADTKWPDLHAIMPSTTPTTTQTASKWRIQNIVQNPHLTALYMHHRFTAFNETVLQQLLHASDHWYRTEWQHRGSAHIHGFLWLKDAPDMSKLDWNNILSVQNAINYFDTYVSGWNYEPNSLQQHKSSSTTIHDPCLLDTQKILQTEPISDYNELINFVERHTKCTPQTCLRKVGPDVECRYKAPWSLQEISTLEIDANGQPKHTPARNDDRLNLHSPAMLSIWRANIDCKAVVSIDAVLKYIAKYATKAENKSETYHSMLSRISTTYEPQRPVADAFRKMLVDNIVDRDISAQETSHLLQKLPLTICSRTFFPLNLNQLNLQRIPLSTSSTTTSINFIDAYISRPSYLQEMPLIEVARRWTYRASRKSAQWKQRSTLAIVRVSPRFTIIPSKDEDCYHKFCLAELLLYHPFRNIQNDFGTNEDDINAKWEAFQNCYHPWHARRTTMQQNEDRIQESSTSPQHVELQQNEQSEWQVLSSMHPGNPFQLDEIDMLGRRELDVNYNWDTSVFTSEQKIISSKFIDENRHTFQFPTGPIVNTFDGLSADQQKAFDIVKLHLTANYLQQPLRMIVQGTAGTGKSHLIKSIRFLLSNSTQQGQSPLLVLAPTGVAAFNIGASTIHSALQVPIKNMQPLIGQSLAKFQEKMFHIKYIIIDEMSFIGPKLLELIDRRLREAFPEQNHIPFGGRSIILFGDLAQLPPVRDIPMYASASYGGTLWHTFTTVVTLHQIFRQSGDNPDQIRFRTMLTNLRNAEPVVPDWELLMSRSFSKLTNDEQSTFLSSMHLFATNDMVSNHNKRMLLSLAKPVAISNAEKLQGSISSNPEDEQLQAQLLLSIDQQVMLCSNLWVQAGLVNGALGQVKSIIYKEGEKPPQLPLFVVVQFKHYIGPPWDENNPKYVPVTPLSRGRRRQIPLKMAWALTIHKSQGLTLERASIDIGSIDRQGLTFTAFSRVRALHSLCVQPSFTFERYARMQQGPHVHRRKCEEQRLLLLSEATK